MCMETFLGIRISMHGIRDFLYRHTNLLQQRLESHRFESNETMHASIAGFFGRFEKKIKPKKTQNTSEFS